MGHKTIKSSRGSKCGKGFIGNIQNFQAHIAPATGLIKIENRLSRAMPCFNVLRP